MSASKLPLWWQVAGGRSVMLWAEHARQPYAPELLLALQRIGTVNLVVAFDGFYYDRGDVDDQLCTLSLMALPRGGEPINDRDVAYLQTYAYAWLDGWRARVAS